VLEVRHVTWNQNYDPWDLVAFDARGELPIMSCSARLAGF